jgi:hypothetical protein
VQVLLRVAIEDSSPTPALSTVMSRVHASRCIRTRTNAILRPRLSRCRSVCPQSSCLAAWSAAPRYTGSCSITAIPWSGAVLHAWLFMVSTRSKMGIIRRPAVAASISHFARRFKQTWLLSVFRQPHFHGIGLGKLASRHARICRVATDRTVRFVRVKAKADPGKCLAVERYGPTLSFL